MWGALRLIMHTIPLASCLPHPLLQHFVRRSMFPTKRYHRYEHDAPLRRKPVQVSLLPLVHLVGSVPHHFLIAQYQCSLTDSTCYGMDSQMVPSKSLCGRSSAIAWWPQRRRFVQRHRQHPHFYLNWMATQPTAVKILVDRKYAPVPSSAVERAKSGMCPMSWLGFHWRTAPFEIPTPTCDATTSSKRKLES